MSQFSLFNNYPLWASLTAMILAQTLKSIGFSIINRKWDWRWLAQPGGMPSGHTAAVTSLATAVGIWEGLDSSLFAMSIVLAIIVMYDATGVRRQAGMQAQVLNQLMDDFSLLLKEISQMKVKTPQETRTKLKEILGHQPIEVFIGAWVGILVSFIIYWFWMG